MLLEKRATASLVHGYQFEGDVDLFRVMIAFAILKGWFDRPYLRQRPVAAEEIDIDDAIDEERHESIMSMIHDKDAMVLWDGDD